MRYSIFLACILLNTITAFASSPQAKTFSICFESWTPYYAIDNSGQISGPLIELSNTIFKHLNITIHYIEKPHNRCIRETLSGIHLAVLTVAERDEGLLTQHDLPVAVWRLTAIVRNGSSHNRFTNMSQFDNQVVALMNVYTYPDIISSRKDKWAKVFGMSYGEETLRALRLIKRNRIDVLIADNAYVTRVISENGFANDFIVLKPTIVNEPYYVGFSKQYKMIYKNFYSMLKKFKEDGELDKFYLNSTGKSWRDEVSKD